MPNKVTKELKDMILGALSDAGGQAYLAARAKDTPVAFMALLGKVLPTQVTGKDGKDLPAASIAPIINVTLSDGE